MAFHELHFLLLFFPLAMVLYLLIPQKGKNILLVVLSLLFFAWGSVTYMPLLALSILFNYLSGLRIGTLKKEEKEKTAKLVLYSAVAVNLLLLGFFKYWGFVLENINALFKTNIPLPQYDMPLGISFFTFSVLSFLFDIAAGKVAAPGSFLDFSLYVSFFPKLVSGPIVSYHDFTQQLASRKVSKNRLGGGCRLFLIGLAKKVLIADILADTFYALTGLPLEEVSALSAWLGTLSYTLMLYYDFSGYSDMAIGIAQMFGFTFGKNFDYPYLATGISDFWRRWHISLGAWFRDYVYFPLGGSRVEKGKIIRNLLVVWLLTGIWHGANWTFLVWGLYHGALQLLEKFVLKTLWEKLPGWVKIPFTFLAVLIGWVFFFSPDLGFALTWLGRMVGIGTVAVDAAARYYLAGGWAILLIAALGANPLPARLGSNLYRLRGSWGTALSVAWFAVLLMLCIAGMTGSTYSSFLYFRF